MILRELITFLILIKGRRVKWKEGHVVPMCKSDDSNYRVCEELRTLRLRGIRLDLGG